MFCNLCKIHKKTHVFEFFLNISCRPLYSKRYLNTVVFLWFFSKFLRTLFFNPLSANLMKWSNTLKQFVGILPTNCLSVFAHFVVLALKVLIEHIRWLLLEVFQFLPFTRNRFATPIFCLFYWLVSCDIFTRSDKYQQTKIKNKSVLAVISIFNLSLD